MHTLADTVTRDRTLARYGARHHTRAYLLTRAAIRAALYVIPFTLAFLHTI